MPGAGLLARLGEGSRAQGRGARGAAADSRVEGLRGPFLMLLHHPTPPAQTGGLI